MSPEQEHRLEQIFNGARGLQAQERAAFLEQACAGDAELRREAEALLQAHEQAADFLQATAPSSPSTPTENPGDRIGHYKLLEQIGQGGFGTVWMAEQEEPVRRRVALKIIKLGMDTKEVVARFEAERQALALMDHPNIARVFDGGATETGRPYFVMELVKGVPITQYCDAGKLPAAERLGLFMQVCQAVQHAHQKGVIHRDLKPSNILVTVRDDKPVPKVIDFGVAKATQARLTEKTVFTRFHQWIGTPAYMSPEQAGLGSFDVDTRSDIYSLGVLLYELLTGRPPFDAQQLLAAGQEAVMRTIREEEPPKPSTRLSTLSEEELGAVADKRGAEPAKLNRLVRGDLDWIVMKALEKDRTRRYETASAFAQDIAHFLAQEPVSAAAPAVGYRLRKFARRNRLSLSLAALFILLALVGATVSTWEAVRATRFAREAARQERLAIDEAARATRLAKEASLQGELAGREAARAKELAIESEKARARADQEAAVAAAVNEFLKRDLLARTVPRAEAEKEPEPEPEMKVRTLLDRASEKIGGRFTNQPLVEASLRATIASAYHDLGLYATQAVHARLAAELYTRDLGETNLLSLRMMEAWGDAERHLGHGHEAVRILETVCDVEERVLGPSDMGTLSAMNLLGIAYTVADQNDQGLALLAEALKRAEVTLARTNALITELLRNRAVLLEEDGQWAEAEQACREHLAITRDRVGPAHIETLNSLFHLAMVLNFEDKFGEAETFFREALAVSDKLGRTKEENELLIRNLGIVLAGQKKFREAESALREALALRRARPGEESAATVDLLARLAHVLDADGRFAEAEPLLREGVEILQRRPNIQDWTAFQVCSGLVLALDAQGRQAELESAVRDLQALVRQRPASSSGAVMGTLILSGALAKQGKQAELEALLCGNWHAAEFMALAAAQPMPFPRSKPLTASQALQKLTVVIEAHPEINHGLALLARAAIHGRLGRWKEAADDLARWFAREPTSFALPLVPLWMKSGNVSGYERYSRDLWSRYNSSPGALKGPLRYTPGKGWVHTNLREGDPATAAEVVLALAIYPHAQDYKNTDTLAERAVERGANHPSLSRFQMVLGLVDYRFGRFASAAEWGRRSLAGTNVGPSTAVMANAVMAIANQKLRQLTKAAEALQQAKVLLQTNLPPITNGARDRGENWPDWLMADLLVNEAAGVDPVAPAEQSNDGLTNRLINIRGSIGSGSICTNHFTSFQAREGATTAEPPAREKSEEPVRPWTLSGPKEQIYFPVVVAAVVNESVISGSEVREKVSAGERWQLRPQYTNDQAVMDALESLIERELILNEAISAGRQVTKEHLHSYLENQIESVYGADSNALVLTLAARGMTVEGFLERHRRDDLVNGATQEKLDAVPQPTPGQIEEYYHSHENDFRVDETAKLSLITINKVKKDRPAGTSPAETAAGVYARLTAGEDFGAIAKLYSEDSFHANGGDRSWVERRQLRKELADVAFSLKPGALSPLIETKEAWYVMRVGERRLSTLKPLGEVQADISKRLYTAARSAAYRDWISKLKRETFIRYEGCGAGTARPQERVVQIELRRIGASTVDDTLIRSNLCVRTGEIVTERSLEQDIRSLYATGDFFAIRIVAETMAGGARLIYVLQENPVLMDLQFSGNKTISSRDLLQKVESKIGGRMQEAKLFKDSQRIQRAYEDAGYPVPKAKYTLSIDQQGRQARVNFELTETP